MLSKADGPAGRPTDVAAHLRELFGRCLNVPEGQLDEDESFFSLGLTSLIHHEVVSSLMKTFGELSSTVLFEYPNLRLLAKHLATRRMHSNLG